MLALFRKWWDKRWCARHGCIFPPKPGAPDGTFARTLRAGELWADTSKPCSRCGATVASAPKAA